jgi:hypothetical protein
VTLGTCGGAAKYIESEQCMPWLPPVPDDEMPAELDNTLAAQRKTFGTVLNSTRLAAHTPALDQGTGGMSRALSRSGRTPRRLSYLLNLRVAAIVGCPL